MSSKLLTKQYSVINTPITNVNFDEQEIIDNTMVLETVFVCGTVVKTLNGGRIKDKEIEHLNEDDIISVNNSLYKVVNIIEDYK